MIPSNIRLVQGENMFKSKCITLVNPCNCIGVAGGGLSAIFRDNFPAAYDHYMTWCKTPEYSPKPGDLAYHEPLENGHNVLHFPTKYDWKMPSEISYLDLGLKEFVEQHQTLRIQSVAFPALGCGLGGLKWDDVQPIMLYYLKQVAIPVEIYLPQK